MFSGSFWQFWLGIFDSYIRLIMAKIQWHLSELWNIEILKNQLALRGSVSHSVWPLEWFSTCLCLILYFCIDANHYGFCLIVLEFNIIFHTTILNIEIMERKKVLSIIFIVLFFPNTVLYVLFHYCTFPITPFLVISDLSNVCL